jgi:sugar porter (SP) family MFS transporter
VTALFTLGGVLGALSTIAIGDRLGRRRTIFFASGLVIIGALLMSSSYSLAQFIVARLVQGIGTGATTATAPVWQSELSGSSHRGSHVVTEGLFISTGIAVSLWIDFGFYFIGDSSVSWRVPLVIQVPLAIMVMAFIFMMPESPRWLVLQNKIEDAREILGVLRDVDPSSETVQTEIAAIETSLEMIGSVSRWDLFKMGEKRNFHRLALGMGAQSFSQLCGINGITFYATIIFEERLGLGATVSRILSAAMTSVQIIGALAAVFTIDRLGRRPLMLISATGMCVSMAILTGTTATTGNQPALIVAVVCLFIYNMSYPFGFLGLTFLYSTEIAPPHLRAKISGISNCMTWLFNFVVVEVTPTGFENINYQYYIIWAVINFAIIVIVFFLFPETNGRTLEEMDEIFMLSDSIFDSTRVARSLPKRAHLDHEAGYGANIGKEFQETQNENVAHMVENTPS